MKIHLFLIILVLVSVSSVIHAAQVDGHVYLEGENTHGGITVTLTRTLDTPSLSVWGILILLPLTGYFISRRRYGMGATLGALMITLTVVTRLWAFSFQTVQTSWDGRFYFPSVETGTYILQAEKDCFRPISEQHVEIRSDFTHLPDHLMSALIPYNTETMPGKIRAIQCAQEAYNNNSFPHTYTDDLAKLVSGEGAGGIGFLDDDYADGVISGYQLVMVRTPFPESNGSYWSWSATAYPIVYGCDGILTYYIDQGPTCGLDAVRAGDTGGAPGDETLPFQCTDQQPDLAQITMQDIARAQTDYNNNSSPHTYTGDLGDLATGAGAGNVPFICSDLGDGAFCGYRYFMTAAEPDQNGSRWAWSATAWPMVYGGSTVMSFYIDECGLIRRGDIGGGMGDLSLPPIDYIADSCD